jgi:hypothetical protein
MFNNKMERLQIVLQIVNNLKNFKCKNNTIINLYDDNLCHFITELKQIFNDYIKQDESNLQDYKGTLYFEEIGKNIDYLLPCKKNVSSLFVIRGRKVKQR